jgi:hypothetical protein
MLGAYLQVAVLDRTFSVIRGGGIRAGTIAGCDPDSDMGGRAITAGFDICTDLGPGGWLSTQLTVVKWSCRYVMAILQK